MNFFRITLFLFLLLFNSLLFGQSINQIECEKLIERGIELMFQKQHVQSLELLVEAAAAAEENNWPKQEFRALLNTGSNYYSVIRLFH